jgi:hypothetical protein
MIILKRKYLFKMPKGWKCQKNLPNEKTLPNFEPKGRLRSEAQEKPDAENKLIFCSLKELQHSFNCLLFPRCQKNNLNLEPTVHKGIPYTPIFDFELFLWFSPWSVYDARG